jgi:hypothetical protein
MLGSIWLSMAATPEGVSDFEADAHPQGFVGQSNRVSVGLADSPIADESNLRIGISYTGATRV